MRVTEINDSKSCAKLIHAAFSSVFIIIFCLFGTIGPVQLIQWVKIAHSFLQSVSNLFHFIILSLPM